MGVNAFSLQIQTSKPVEALRRIGSSMTRLHQPGGIIAFASGSLASRLQGLAEDLCDKFPGVPALFASSDGVFTEQGELEDQDGLVCLLLGGAKLGVTLQDDARLAPLGSADSSESGETVAMRPIAHSKLLVASSKLGPPGWCHLEGELPAALGWFGAVASSDAPIWGVDVDGRVRTGAVGLVEFPGLEAPLVVGSPCCRLITQLQSVSSVDGCTILELDGVPALVALGQASSKLVDRSWIVVALSDDANCIPTTNDGTPNLLFRPVRGVDPARGAILLTEPVSVGTRLAFAVRDDRAARRSLEDALRTCKHRLCGGAPRFGFYFDGLGRGRSLYGAQNVDLGLVKHALGDFPILGMRSAYELRGDVGKLGTQTLMGQLALFRNPS
jgi:small ligand-binding sensory domain FIST